MFLKVLDQYVEAVTGAHAYMNRYYGRYDDNKQYNIIASMAEKLGVQTRGRYSRNTRTKYRYKSSNNYVSDI